MSLFSTNSLNFGTSLPSVDCKVYFTPPNGEEEIRCIQLNGFSRCDFVHLRFRIIDLFPILRDHDFVLHWKDEEGDKIKISSNEDLLILLNRGSFRAKKIYVTLTEQKGYPSINILNSGPVVHNGVTCDGCQQNPLQGYRYKCIVCPDFDLCINCEKSEKIHSHHPMIRFPVPLTSETFFSNEYESIRNNVNGILQMFT
ncbi:unnamed protein product [Nezara viridula]|uniref:ZZ-type domain-containing protein n=1 Tax=Nezara viridula TaxID=85310 RepID=A0A9P0EDJ5_NEZVI|nr:unnamed protein product [Nezara viridula]